MEHGLLSWVAVFAMYATGLVLCFREKWEAGALWFIMAHLVIIGDHVRHLAGCGK